MSGPASRATPFIVAKPKSKKAHGATAANAQATILRLYAVTWGDAFDHVWANHFTY